MLFKKLTDARMNLRRPLSPHLKSALRHLIISFIILTPLISSYLFFDLNALDPLLLKLKSAFILHGLRSVFRLFGFEIPLLVLVSIVSSIVGSNLHMMDPAGGQPAANPAAEQPSNVPSVASNSVESSETSVTQQPMIPELHPPLLDDNTRRAELDERLRTNWYAYAYTERNVDSFVRIQLQIDKHMEAALVEDGYSRQMVFEKRNKIRGFFLYPKGRALDLDTYKGHLDQIENWGTRQSVPYRYIRRALTHYDLILD